MMALKEHKRNSRRHFVFAIPDNKEAEYNRFFAKNPMIPRSAWVRAFVEFGIEMIEKKGGFDPLTLRPKGM